MFFQEGLAAFDIFADKAQKILEQGKRIRDHVADRHPLIIVDEAQDTAEEQWACVKALAGRSQLVCLADLDQQIYDFRPGVSAQRLVQIVNDLKPDRVDLKSQNHRSPGSEIIEFGNDVLLSTPRAGPYKGVTRVAFRPNATARDAAIRQSVGRLNKIIKDQIASAPKNIAILSSWGKGVAIISRALTGNGGTISPISHHVYVDEASILLASRLVAFLLEPKSGELSDLAEALNLTAALFRSKGSATHLKTAKSLLVAADKCRNGKVPGQPAVAKELRSILANLRQHAFSGDPSKDWPDVRRCLQQSSAKPLKAIASDAEQLMVFNRGRRISEGLAEQWQTNGSYFRARAILDSALMEEQLLSGSADLRGINVMTIHKAKGKEFDGVVIFDESRNSPLLQRGDAAPHPRSRKLLRVAITRAKHHVLILTDLFKPTPILKGHKL